jgi:hypothetical protein
MTTTKRYMTLALLCVIGLLPLTGTASAQSYRNSYWWRHRHQNTATASLNQKVLAYAQGMVGKPDGNGECWTLVDDALRSAGANTSGDVNFVFGQPIATSSVIPGDVIQFTSAKFVHTNPGGGSSWFTLGYPNHTAIVSSVQGGQITLLNQNINGNRTVQYTTINLGGLQSGSMQAYRPQ